MSIGSGLILMGAVFLVVWLAFLAVSEFVIRRDRRANEDDQ